MIHSRGPSLCRISSKLLLIHLFASTFPAAIYGQTALPIDALPDPPPKIQALLDSGNVDFVQGTELLRTEDSEGLAKLPQALLASLQKQSLRPDPSLPLEYRLAAITSYSVNFRYTQNSSWSWNSVTRVMTISMRGSLKLWEPMHTVWFREMPAETSFWSNRLVLHEMDHVQLSSDVILKNRFARTLREGQRVQISLSGSQLPSDQLADERTERWVKEKFNEMIDLVDIRYQELDRVTRHGILDLTSKSSLYQSLRDPTPTSDK